MQFSNLEMHVFERLFVLFNKKASKNQKNEKFMQNRNIFFKYSNTLPGNFSF